MADFTDNRPIAVRKERRTSCVYTRIMPNGIATPPATPKRSKKHVRFSDPGPLIESNHGSSGLTPFIQRTAISTPKSKRRHSTPLLNWNLASGHQPRSGTLQFEPLRQVLDGRVKRRLTRHRLSEEANKIQAERRYETKSRHTEVERIREELEARDAEMQLMRGEQDIASHLGDRGINTNVVLDARVHELEQQIVALKAELQTKYDTEDNEDWTMAARDPYQLDDDDLMITNYSNDFHESTMDDEMMTTPTRLRTSFPSPPSSMPNTPSKACSVHSAGIQTSFSGSDPETDLLRAQLESLQREIGSLTSAIALKSDTTSRLETKLSEYMGADEDYDDTSLDAALDKVLTQLAISQSLVLEKENAFSALSSEINGLGFASCSGAEEILKTIAAQFRQARLDLEYMTPGEIVEGFENEKLLEMLVNRMKVLGERVKDGDDQIDQYHDQELLLRQQLNTRVSVMEELRGELSIANSVAGGLRHEIDEKEISNSRLQKALDGYREEVKNLEALISRLEKEGQDRQDVLQGELDELSLRLQDETLKHDTTRACEEGNQIIIMELERRLDSAVKATEEIEAQLVTLNSSNSIIIADKDAAIEQLERSTKERELQHGEALAYRDARVSELRAELERITNELKTAQSTIMRLRNDSRDLEEQIEGEKTRGQVVVAAMRDQLNRVLETGMSYINGDVSVQRRRDGSCPAFTVPNSESRSRREGSAPAAITLPASNSGIKPGRYLDGGLARRESKKRRRYDSGLGFLEEEDVAAGSSPV